jgi:hypothetical protein
VNIRDPSGTVIFASSDYQHNRNYAQLKPGALAVAQQIRTHMESFSANKCKERTETDGTVDSDVSGGSD